MADPIALRPKPSAGLVPMLTELLARAQRGEIQQFACVFTEPGSDGYGAWISDSAGGTLKLIGAITDLQWTALRLHNEQQREG